MNDTAHRLRAQKAYSTDLAYLERMAREEETRGVDPINDANRLWEPTSRRWSSFYWTEVEIDDEDMTPARRPTPHAKVQ